MTKQAVQRYESSLSIPKLATWEKLADYFDVPVSYLMGIDEMRKRSKDSIQRMKRDHGIVLQTQLDRLQNTDLNPMQPLTVAKAIELVMDLYDKYDFNSEETTEISTILNALTFMINNSIDDDDDYQNTIDGFTKLVNNLKEQNKKASD